jgi:glycosyltransferase involved in cell wall biosynthesis
MDNISKPVVLTFINNYLPGYKAGGIPRSMINTVENLSDYINFWIVTRDRDLGDTKPYSSIKKNQWQTVGSTKVYYLSPQTSSFKNLKNLILTTKHEILYLNSFFDTFTIKMLLIRKFGGIAFAPVIVAPRGEFASAALKIKYLRKFIFIQIVRFIGLYKDITWHASSEFEEKDISHRMKIGNNLIHNALDLPTRYIPDDSISPVNNPTADYNGLKIIFLSRIARVKNLDYALQILSKVKARVFFDIYGTLEDLKYWNECQELIEKLPGNIKVNYLGTVKPDKVVPVFGFYDLFLFPSGGENYGHVIAESLTAGTPVLISNKTPWKNLKKDNLGWDFPLEQSDSFIETIEYCAALSREKKLENRESIKSMILNYLLDPVVLEDNRELFLKRVLVKENKEHLI